MRISAMTAACLCRRPEGAILLWIGEGLLPAQRDHHQRLQVDTADLLKVPHLSIAERYAVQAYVAQHCPVTTKRKAE
jgi:hypothetical protein